MCLIVRCRNIEHLCIFIVIELHWNITRFFMVSHVNWCEQIFSYSLSSNFFINAWHVWLASDVLNIWLSARCPHFACWAHSKYASPPKMILSTVHIQVYSCLWNTFISVGYCHCNGFYSCQCCIIILFSKALLNIEI